MSSKKPKIAARETPDATDATEALDNLRREKFCRYYAQGEGTFGNATLSYAAAYDIELGDLSIVDKEGRPVVEKDFRGQYEVCATNGWRLLKNADVQARITVLLNALLKDEIVDAELAKVIKQDGDLTPKVAAIKEFNKLRGRIIEKTQSTILERFDIEDVRTIISVLPQEEQDAFYEHLNTVINRAEEHRRSTTQGA
ncbi:MAG: hypothetical protein BGO51_15535 [Rhodospirillales bacterium 69-11]|nr:MAG: hypothetical protein BGO51_15535 [Rhodospirillales bacterium 69-11]